MLFELKKGDITKIQYITAGLSFAVIAGAIGFHTLTARSQSLLSEEVVLFAEESIELDKGVTIASGDVLSNGVLDIDKDASLQGSAIADTIDMDKNGHIFGNAEADTIKLDKDAAIDGETITPRETADFAFPEILSFTAGTQNLTIGKSQTVTISPGSYRKLSIASDAHVTADGGTYNLAELVIDRDAILNFNQPTTFNISNKFTIGKHVIFNLDPSLDVTDVVFNYTGHQLVSIGQNGFLTGKVLAPDAQMFVGKEGVWRGQILAKEIIIKKETIFSREFSFTKSIDGEKIVNDIDGSVFLVDQIIVNFNDSASLADALNFAKNVEGRIIGYAELTNAYQIEIFVTIAAELETKIEALKAIENSLVEGIFRNYVLNFIN